MKKILKIALIIVLGIPLAWYSFLLVASLWYSLQLRGPFKELEDKLNQEIHKAAVLDRKPIPNSPYVGQEVELAPFAEFYKMKDFGGWTDEFLYVMTHEPRKEKYVEIIFKSNNMPRDNNGYSKFKVTEAVYQTNTSGPGSKKEICILSSVIETSEKISARCEILEDWRKVTEMYRKIEKEILNNKSAFIATRNYGRKLNIKPFASHDSFSVYEFKNMNEFVSSLRNDNGFEQYEFFDSKYVVLLNKREKYNSKEVIKELRAGIIERSDN